MTFEIFITLTIISCFVILNYSIALIKRDLDEIKKMVKEK